MALIDEAVIVVQSGAGGDGCSSFRREKYIPRGGPDGGNGGRGGNVYLVGTDDKSSLLDFKYQPLFRADRGEHGKGKDMDGRGGEDLNLLVPLGTLVYNKETGELLHDIVEKDVPVRVAKGGRGGRGNLSFVSSTNRAPRTKTPGEEGERIELRLELRLLADVGLVGLPNAGKSSFLRRISRAHPKVADYPFTTIEPSLGVVYHKDQSFVVADLPGLIEGAADGVGLGHRFLRHVSRTNVLLHLVELTEDIAELQKNILTIRSELQAYDSALLDKQEILVFTKADLWAPDALAKLETKIRFEGINGFFISSQSGYGVDELLDLLSQHVQQRNKAAPPAVADLEKPTEESENPDLNLSQIH